MAATGTSPCRRSRTRSRPRVRKPAATAHFVCVLSLCWPDGHVESFEGRCEGTLTWPPRGKMGFGYDPVFVPLGDTRSFAELDPDEKHANSHRAAAFRKLVAAVL